MNNCVKKIDGVESEVGENQNSEKEKEKEKWRDMLPEEEDMICRLHRLLGDRYI